ncbi:DUF116 domain-containing protein [Methanobrevibacter sp. DSM 116169]|uniref:DUF116 domain-containing protein n=1 Tax=Methanobrevibacter sp. DSM 116169 TaxID=3242727 RepID=UPI0038FBFC81
MVIESLYQLLGQSLILFIILLVILSIATLILGKVLIKKDILIFPQLIIFVLDMFYSPLKKIAKALKFDESLVDHMGVEVRNNVNRAKFLKIPPEKKIIFLPHCLRHKDCEAVLNETGLVCTKCNKCSIGFIMDKAEPMGYRLFIVPGSSFVKKIAKENKFESVVGIACYEDLNQIMMVLSDFYPQGAVLSRTGCYNTKVDVKSVLDVIGYVEPTKEEIKIDENLCTDKSKNT